MSGDEGRSSDPRIRAAVDRFKACPGPGSGFCICGVCARIEKEFGPKPRRWRQRLQLLRTHRDGDQR